MNVTGPPSPHCRPLSLQASYNRRRSELPEVLRPAAADNLFGDRTIRGIPFWFGPADAYNAVLLDGGCARLELAAVKASYLIFVHCAEDIATDYLDELADSAVDGNAIGGVVSDYTLFYGDGSSSATPVIRRFAIQQSRIGVGASAFAAVPAWDDRV